MACYGSGKPHVFFRVVLDHTVVIQQQLSCAGECSSSDQPGCRSFPDPTYKVVSGKVVGPAGGSAPLKILISQAPETEETTSLVITTLDMFSFSG